MCGLLLRRLVYLGILDRKCSDPIVHSLVSETRRLTSKLLVMSGTTCQSRAQLTATGFLLSASPWWVSEELLLLSMTKIPPSLCRKPLLTLHTIENPTF